MIALHRPLFLSILCWNTGIIHSTQKYLNNYFVCFQLLPLPQLFLIFSNLDLFVGLLQKCISTTLNLFNFFFSLWSRYLVHVTLLGLWNPEVQFSNNKGYSIILILSSKTLCDVSDQSWLLQCEVVSLMPYHQAGGPLLVGCPRLLIQYIRS